MKQLSITGLFILLALNLSAQNSLLWKVSGNGAEKPSYLFGTIHAICPDDFVMSDQLNEAVINTDCVFLEIDMTDPQFMIKMSKGSMNPEMKNIKGDLSEEEQLLVNEALVKATGFGLDQMGIMKPWALAATITIKTGLECQEPASYEMALINLAKANQKPVKGLETIEDQLALFDGIPYDKQLKWLVESVKEEEINKSLLSEMIAAYKQQNVTVLHELMLEQDEMEEFADILLDQRNKKWIPVIAEAMKDGSNVFAFGAGHLGGENGVIKLLKKAGYTVEEVQ